MIFSANRKNWSLFFDLADQAQSSGRSEKGQRGADWSSRLVTFLLCGTNQSQGKRIFEVSFSTFEVFSEVFGKKLWKLLFVKNYTNIVATISK